MDENKVCGRLKVCRTNTAGFCLRSAVLSSVGSRAGTARLVQALPGSRCPEVILLPARFSGCRASSGCRKVIILCFAELQVSCGASWSGQEGQEDTVWPWWGAALPAAPEPIHAETEPQSRQLRSFSELVVSSLLIIIMTNYQLAQERKLSVQVTTDLKMTLDCRDVKLL